MKTYSPLHDIDSVKTILSKISVWGGFTDEQQGKIYKLIEIGIFRKGEHIFCKGDQPTHIYIIKSGMVDIFLSDQEVNIQKETVETGGCFGMAALMAMYPFMATAIAAEDSEIMVLSRQALLGLRHEDTELFALLMMNISRELARRLKSSDNMLLQHVHEHKLD